MTTPLDQTERARFTEGDMPTLPPELRNIIGEYGMARTAPVGPMEIEHRWLLLIVAIKRYAAGAAWEAWQAAIASSDARIAELESRNEHLSKSWDESLYQGLVAAAKSDVLADLLRDALGPLEVSAAVIESDDSEQMEDLIARIKAALTATDQASANLTPPTAAKAAKETPDA